MLITEEKLRKALRAMPGAYNFFGRYAGTESRPVRIYYLMDWYQEYYGNIPEEEKEEAEGVQKASYRRFSEQDWDYVIRCSSGIYAKMAWDRIKGKYMKQLRQNQLLEKVASYLD